MITMICRCYLLLFFVFRAITMIIIIIFCCCDSLERPMVWSCQLTNVRSIASFVLTCANTLPVAYSRQYLRVNIWEMAMIDTSTAICISWHRYDLNAVTISFSNHVDCFVFGLQHLFVCEKCNIATPFIIIIVDCVLMCTKTLSLKTVYGWTIIIIIIIIISVYLFIYRLQFSGVLIRWALELQVRIEYH